MESLKQAKENLNLISSLKDITSAYQTLSNMRMNQIQDEVLNTRNFLEGVAQIYNHAKAAYFSQAQKETKNGSSDFSFLRKNKKEVTLFLSANERFYGTLLLDTFKEVQNYLNNNKTDLVVAGEIGRSIIKNQSSSQKIDHYFRLDDENPSPREMKRIFNYINDYEDVVVFHGRFQTPLRQDPVKTSVSGGVSFGRMPDKTREYLFEPSPKEIIKFFENEIREALFKQAVLEHQLARFASRMIAMDQATQNADEKIKKLKYKTSRLKTQMENKKQINRVIRSNLITDN
ncbi:MAG: F0F1 ATP synthase subunit gamma [Minisyncoccales bacterium]